MVYSHKRRNFLSRGNGANRVWGGLAAEAVIHLRAEKFSQLGLRLFQTLKIENFPIEKSPKISN
jgi:hypothetical protein